MHTYDDFGMHERMACIALLKNYAGQSANMSENAQTNILLGKFEQGGVVTESEMQLLLRAVNHFTDRFFHAQP